MKKLFKKLFNSLAIILLLGSLVSKTTPIAFAHHPIISGTVVCESSQTKKVNWTITNSESNKTMTIDEVDIYYEQNDSTPDNHSNSLTDQIDNIENDVVAANGSIQATNTLSGSTTGYIKLKVKADFSGPGNDDIERDVTLNLGASCVTPDAVSITEFQPACGAGNQTISGTATYESTNNRHLVVKVDGIEKLHAHNEPTNWSFISNLSVGNHTVVATIYDSSNENLHDSEIESTDTWTFAVGNCITDVCTNIDGVQESLPNNYYFASAGICAEKTPVCTDPNASNFDSDVTSNEYANNNVCQYPLDVCSNIDGTQTSLPDGYHFDGEGICLEDEVETTPTPTPTDEVTCGENQTNQNGICIDIECDGGAECEVVIGTPTPTPTPTETPTGTPTPTPDNTSIVQSSVGGSDGRSDGRSDGLGGQAPAAGQVLGASTMADTGSFGSLISKALFALGLTFTTLASAGHAKKKK